MTWQPILHGQDAVRARTIAADIADSITDSDDPFAPLLDAYLAKELQSDRHAERAVTALERLIARTPPRGPALYRGLSGIGFMWQHLSSELEAWMEPDNEDALKDIDSSLIEVVRHYPARGNYDLISGLAGVATYAIERLPRDSARELLGVVIDRLDADAVSLPSGTAWHTMPELLPEHQRQVAPAGYYNLGVAHGIPALALVLAHAVAHGVRAPRAEKLLNDTIAWIAAQQRDAGDGARFPAWIAVGVEPGHGSREAWCYGGLGLSVTLLRAARLVNSAEWEALALDFGALEAGRTKAQSGVADVCLCHGAAGNAHLYARLYNATGNDLYFAAAKKWLLHTLDDYQPGRGVGGFLFWQSDAMTAPFEMRWQPDTTVLSGSPGVGLALLAASGTHEPKWDRLLAADAPVRLHAEITHAAKPRTS